MGLVQGTGRVERSVEVCQDFYKTVTQTTHISVSDSNSSGVSTGRGPSVSSGWATGRSGSSEYAERVGAAGEVFLFSWLSQWLPGFTASSWVSGNRVHLTGAQQLQPPEDEPPFDFTYTDVEGKLTGEPGTLCYIECKATSADVSRHLMPIAITSREWALAQKVHNARLAGTACQYVLFRVDRVGQSGGPRVAAVLIDPVQLLYEGQMRITGDQLRIDGYTTLKQGD